MRGLRTERSTWGIEIRPPTVRESCTATNRAEAIPGSTALLLLYYLYNHNHYDYCDYYGDSRCNLGNRNQATSREGKVYCKRQRGGNPRNYYTATVGLLLLQHYYNYNNCNKYEITKQEIRATCETRLMITSSKLQERFEEITTQKQIRQLARLHDAVTRRLRNPAKNDIGTYYWYLRNINTKTESKPCERCTI